jgi:hypothetical protein
MSFQIEIDKAIKEKRLYFLGDALPTDWYAAFRVWLPLAEDGDPKAQYNIGRCYNRGDGVDQDSSKAKFWYLSAAEQNDPRALFNLYIFFSDENSSENDVEKAERYLEKAAEMREPRALRVFEDRETKRLEKEAENRIAEFKRVNTETQQQFFDLLKNGRPLAARNFLESITDERVIWLKEYIHLFEVEVTFRGIESKTWRDKKYHGSIIVNGNTAPNISIIDHTDYYAKFSVANNADTDLKINFMRPNGAAQFDLPAKQSTICMVPGHGEVNRYLLRPNEFEYSVRIEVGSEFFDFTREPPVFPMLKPVEVPASSSAKGKEGGCFVLTACYGNENHPVVMDFRNFRDNFLLTNNIGKRLIDFYYRHSPKVADSIETMPVVKMMLRGVFHVIRVCLPEARNKPHDRRGN